MSAVRALAVGLLGPALLALLSGCVCCDRRPARTAAAAPAAPYAPDPAVGAWPYLRAKYDADGDGAITRAEHGRGETAFTHLDRNEDGVITADDLGPGPVHGLMLRMIAMHWFQDDARPRVLSREEFARGFDAIDADDDGLLTAPELARRMASHAPHVEGLPTPPPGMDPFHSVALLLDRDRDGRVSRAEALAGFDAQAQEGVWAMRPPAGPPPGAGRPRGPAVGVQAPDFTLASPDGTRRVTLSDFRGTRPVALIFGSYT